MTEPSSNSPRALWFCLYLPRLGLELFTRSLADGSATRPAVLAEQHRVVQLNGAARAQGLSAGMGLGTAQSICSDLAVALRDPQREIRTLDALANWAWRFTPRVSVAPPDTLLLEVAGSLRLFRGLDRLQQHILAGIRGLGYSGMAGIAPTPLAAQAFARAGRSPDPEHLAGALQFEGRADAGLRHAWSDAIATAARPLLAELPLHYLERSTAEREKLAAMGLNKVADLLRLPRAALARRFGADLLQHLDRLTGRRSDPREPIVPAPVFSSTLHFLEDVENMAGLAFPMRRLSEELADWLRVRQLATASIDWCLRHPRHGDHPIEVRCAVPQRDAARFLELSRLRLERNPGLPAVASMELRVTRLLAHGGTADNLFPTLGEDGEDGGDPAALIDLLHARLGLDVCHSILPADDHRPEHAWRPVRPRSPRQHARNDRSSPPGLAPGPRPLWLLASPTPLTSRDGQPLWHGPLTLCRGPERIDVTPWEDSNAHSPDQTPANGPRDYWVARHDNGSHCWIFQDLATQRWFLHGLFA